MLRFTFLIVFAACSVNNGNGVNTPSFCQDGDTGCECARDPSLPQCGDQPNTIEQQMQAETAEQATELSGGGSVDPSQVTIVNNRGLVRIAVAIFNFGTFAWYVTCTYTYSADLKSHTTKCTVQNHPLAIPVPETAVISPSFCQDGDTGCECTMNPSLPQCGDQPNPYDTLPDTLDYAASQGLQGEDSNRRECSIHSGQELCTVRGRFAGINWEAHCWSPVIPGPPGPVLECSWSVST